MAGHPVGKDGTGSQHDQDTDAYRVYSTTANTYNARDQVALVRQYQGADNSGTYQDTAMTYDGYGRLLTKHVPEQNSGTATTYAYNSDDTVYSVTDARGASATYSYSNRRLVTGISYSVRSKPGSDLRSCDSLGTWLAPRKCQAGCRQR